MSNSAISVRRGLHPAEAWLQELEGWELVPAEERDALVTAVTEAVNSAEAGHPEVGRELLMAGIQRAEDHWRGNPWGGDLVTHYQEAVKRFDGCYGRPSNGSC
jgi:hypothetical protein